METRDHRPIHSRGMKTGRVRGRQALGGILHALGLKRPRPAALSVLMYHGVTADSLNDPGQQSLSASQFDGHMALLRDSGVEILPLEEGVVRVATPGWSGHAVSVVFDDGYAGVHDHALEALVRYRIPATLFLATQWIGQPDFPWAPASLGRPLSWPEVATLIKDGGCSIGSHTHSHRVLTALDSPTVRDELRRSRAAIEHHLGITSRTFAYPYGSYGTFDIRTRRIVSEEGFSVACTTVWGRHRRRDDPLAVKRIRMSWCDSNLEIAKTLAGCYDWYRFVQRLQARHRQLPA